MGTCNTLREKRPNTEFFWYVFCRIRTEYHFVGLALKELKRFVYLVYIWHIFSHITRFELAVRNSQLRSVFRVVNWLSHIVSYFEPTKYPLMNDNMISQRFIVHINSKLYASFFSNYHFVMILQIVSSW